MANTTFPNIDFRFRRGTKEAYQNSQYVEGSLNFTKDEEMMYVHKDGLMFRISDIVLDGGTENQIKSLESPKMKLYLSSDTHRLLWYKRDSMEWIYVCDNSKNSENAEFAEKDINGNKINEYYYPKSEAVADYADLNNSIDALANEVSGIVRFDVVVCSSISDLPPVGKKGTIYLIPISSYYGPDYPTEELDTHVELIYVTSTQYGGFYEEIGNTQVNLDNYYTKSEVDALIAAAVADIEAEFTTYKSEVNNIINGFRTTLNSFMSATNNKFTQIDQQIGTINTNIGSLGGRVTTNEGDIATIKQKFALADQGKEDS